MDEQEIRDQMKRYNRLYKETDDIYHSLARHYGVSDCGFWILYTLRESEQPVTQSKLCEDLSISKQTVHSALKKLEQAGYVVLRSLTGNRKNKRIHLTADGEALAQRTVDRVLAMEYNALGRLSARERALFMRLNQKYTMLLQREAEQLLAAAE